MEIVPGRQSLSLNSLHAKDAKLIISVTRSARGYRFLIGSSKSKYFSSMLTCPSELLLPTVSLSKMWNSTALQTKRKKNKSGNSSELQLHVHHHNVSGKKLTLDYRTGLTFLKYNCGDQGNAENLNSEYTPHSPSALTLNKTCARELVTFPRPKRTPFLQARIDVHVRTSNFG